MTDRTRECALLLPGQGAQVQGMAVVLYRREPVFTDAMDAFFRSMGAEGVLLRRDWLSASPAVPIDDASRAQPLLFAVGYAIGRVLEARGIRPAAYIGHSVGELAAAALAGVFTQGAAGRIMNARSRAMAAVPAGGMTAVADRPENLLPFLAAVAGEVVVGAVNAPMQTVLAGSEPALTEVERALSAAGKVARRVRSRQPFHCPAVRSAAAVFEQAVARERLRPPDTPIWSGRTGRPVSDAEAVDPAFWAHQLAEPVLFWPALSALLDHGAYTLVETGPGPGLALSARRHPAVRSGRSTVCTLLTSRTEGAWEAWASALDCLEPRPVDAAWVGG